MWQARHVAERLGQQGIATELVPLTSRGDTDLRPITAASEVGMFTKRIQQALLEGEADVAVHSLKDLPTEPVPDLVLAGIPPRGPAGDCIVWLGEPLRDGLKGLPAGTRIGTSSRRRVCQLALAADHCQALPIRGNLQTRLEKLRSGEYDALLLAEAGLERLGLPDVPRYPLATDVMLPAPGQGALAIEVRADDDQALTWVATLDDPATRAAVTAERLVLRLLQGGCLAPIAAYATVTPLDGGQEPQEFPAGFRIDLEVRVLSAEPGHPGVRVSRSATWDGPGHPPDAATAVGRECFDELITLGGAELVEQSRLPGPT